ncbi:MAG: DUF6338 family protein [Candidatus Krumholzibacteriota bacterium]|nr:DUF6338 family protein [Candidatus Krumholzibacteriota bacterium]
MDIWSIDKIQLFLAFFIPGFISIKTYSLLVPGERFDFTKQLAEVIGYSALNYAVFSWMLIPQISNCISNHTYLLIIVILVVLLIAPILWPIIILKILKWKWVKEHVISSISKPWDYVFGKKESYWAIVHLKDGRKIAGVYAAKSFSSSYPAKEQIYLEQVWMLSDEGKFERKVARSKGILIIGDEILAIELFK